MGAIVSCQIIELQRRVVIAELLANLTSLSSEVIKQWCCKYWIRNWCSQKFQSLTFKNFKLIFQILEIYISRHTQHVAVHQLSVSV